MIWAARNDKRLWERMKKRGSSNRAAAFLEFTLLAPILMLLISAMFELTQFWDAEVMASHTAWQIGRIATVRGTNLAVGETGDPRAVSGSVPSGSEVVSYLFKGFGSIGDTSSLRNYGNLASVFLMSTCGIGMYGGKASESIGANIYESLIGPLKDLFSAKSIQEGIEKEIESIIGSMIDVPGLSGLAIISQIVKILKDFITKVVTTIFRPIIKLVSEGFAKLFGLVFGCLDNAVADGKMAEARRGRELYGAALRCVKSGGVATVEELLSSKRPGYSTYTFGANAGRLDFPLCVAKNARSDGFLVKDFTGWPPNNGKIAMYHTTVSWPFSSGWLFPVVSGFSSAGDSYRAGGIRAKGTAISFPKLTIENEHLYSEGATAYDDGGDADDIDTELAGLRKRMAAYIRRAAQFLAYRCRVEDVGYDECSVGKIFRAHKHMLPYYDYSSVHGRNNSDFKSLFKRFSDDDYHRCFKGWNKDDGDEYTRESTMKDRGCFDPGTYRNRWYLYFVGKQRARYTWPGENSASAYMKNNMLAKHPAYLTPGREGYPGAFSKMWYSPEIRDKMKELYPGEEGLVSSEDAAPIVFQMRNTLWSSVKLLNQGSLAAKDKELYEYNDKRITKAEPNFRSYLLSYAADLKKIANGDGGEAEKAISDEGEAIIPQDEDVNDPKKFAEQAMARWEKLERRLDELYEQIDSFIWNLPNRYRSDSSRLENCYNRRHQIELAYTCDILHEIDSIVAVKGKCELADIPDIEAAIKSHGKVKNAIAQLAAIQAEEQKIITEYADYVQAQFDRETEYAKSLGSKNAGSADGKSLDDLNFDEHKEGQEERGGGSTYPGDDPGMETEKWEWSDGGWRKAG